MAGRKRQRQVGGGRVGTLHWAEQKLLFILVYTKTYPLQVVLGELFELSQASANEWLQRLLPVLRDALQTLGAMPERRRQFARAERRKGETAEYIIDGTERRRQRPKKPAKQALHYSGKKKTHSDKNVLIVHPRSKRVGYLVRRMRERPMTRKWRTANRLCIPGAPDCIRTPGFKAMNLPSNILTSRKKAPRGHLERS